MAEFSVRLSGRLQLILSGAETRQRLARAVMKTALDAKDLLSEATPKDTGDTAARWQVTQLPTADNLTAVVSNDSEVMLYLEYGTGIYSTYPGAPRDVIRPKRAKALGPVEWMGESGVFFRWIRGMRPTFTVRGNLDRIQRLLEANIREALNGQ